VAKKSANLRLTPIMSLSMMAIGLIAIPFLTAAISQRNQPRQTGAREKGVVVTPTPTPTGTLKNLKLNIKK